MSTIQENRVGPSDISPEEQAKLETALAGHVRPVLLMPGGDVFELPEVLNNFFVSVIQAMSQKQVVFLMHEDEAFTTQAAANYLGISRQQFVRILESGQMPFHRVGTHRRVLFKDLVTYRRERSIMRKGKLNQMTQNLIEAGVYDRFNSLEREDSK